MLFLTAGVVSSQHSIDIAGKRMNVQAISRTGLHRRKQDDVVRQNSQMERVTRLCKSDL